MYLHQLIELVGNDQPSPLYLASVAQDVEMVKILLEHKARPDSYGGIYDNPLQVASRYGNLAIVQTLILAGTDINSKGGKYGTALYAACWGRKVDVARVLLEHHADPNVQGCGQLDNALQERCTPTVAGEHHPELVTLLFNQGANPNLHGGPNGSALHAAFYSGHEPIIRALLERGADTRYKGGEFGTVLQAAVESGSEAVVRIALESGMTANEKGGEYTYPLIRACANENCPDSIVSLLLRMGANPNLKREGEDVNARTFRTALQHTTSISKATMLLDHKAQVSTVAGILGTVLHHAINWADVSDDIVRLFIDHRADVNKNLDELGSPLGLALQLEHLDKARILIGAGAKLDSVDSLGHSALHFYLLVCEKADPNFLEELVDLGLGPLRADRRGCSLLHYAARADSLDVLGKMVKCGANVNVTDRHGWTPLHWGAASTRGSAKAIKFLLKSECDKDMKDEEGRTALELFERTALISILKAEGEAYVALLEDGEPERKGLGDIRCDGCRIVRSSFASQRLDTDISSSDTWLLRADTLVSVRCLCVLRFLLPMYP